MEVLCLLLGLFCFMHAAVLLFYALAPFFMSLFALAAMPLVEEGALFFDAPLLFSGISFATALALFDIFRARGARYTLAAANAAAAAFLLWRLMGAGAVSWYRVLALALHLAVVLPLLIGKKEETRKGREDREGGAHFRAVPFADAPTPMPDAPDSAPDEPQGREKAEMPDMVEWLEMQAVSAAVRREETVAISGLLDLPDAPAAPKEATPAAPGDAQPQPAPAPSGEKK